MREPTELDIETSPAAEVFFRSCAADLSRVQPHASLCVLHATTPEKGRDNNEADFAEENPEHDGNFTWSMVLIACLAAEHCGTMIFDPSAGARGHKNA